MAFGAGQRTIFRMLVGQGLSLSAIGLVIGVVGAYLMTGALSTLLVGVRPNDPLTFAAIAGLFLVVGFVAAGVPAVRAARLSPTVALRDE
jgi:ABC-type antimicrobial peptide transport system permease subunit